MIDLAQADPTLRASSASNAQREAACVHLGLWTRSMTRAAADLGYAHWLDAPTEADDPTFITLARQYYAEGLSR
jgi:hypothetical protein